MTARTSPGDLLPLDGLWAGRDSQAKAPALPLMPTAYPQQPVAVGHFCFRPLLLRKKAALPGKIGPHARRQSTTPAARPAAVGCDRRDGRSQSRPVRPADVAVAPLSQPRLAEASHRGQGQEATPDRLAAPASGTFVSVCDPLRTQVDLHIESEFSGPMPHFSGAMATSRRCGDCTHRARQLDRESRICG